MLSFDYNKAAQWHMIVSRDGITKIPFPSFDLPEDIPDNKEILHESIHYFNRTIPE